jgi:hypothetical protein
LFSLPIMFLFSLIKNSSSFISSFIPYTSCYQFFPVLTFWFILGYMNHHIKYYLSNTFNNLVILAYFSLIQQNCSVGFIEFFVFSDFYTWLPNITRVNSTLSYWYFCKLESPLGAQMVLVNLLLFP